MRVPAFGTAEGLLEEWSLIYPGANQRRFVESRNRTLRRPAESSSLLPDSPGRPPVAEFCSGTSRFSARLLATWSPRSPTWETAARGCNRTALSKSMRIRFRASRHKATISLIIPTVLSLLTSNWNSPQAVAAGIKPPYPELPSDYCCPASAAIPAVYEHYNQVVGKRRQLV